jgi:hypothetical protein
MALYTFIRYYYNNSTERHVLKSENILQKSKRLTK